jgi:hypothetical protein
MLRYIFIFLTLTSCVKKADSNNTNVYKSPVPPCDLDPLFCNDDDFNINLDDLPEHNDTGEEE